MLPSVERRQEAHCLWVRRLRSERLRQHGRKARAEECVIEYIDQNAQYYSLEHERRQVHNPPRHEDTHSVAAI
jgi:hypothetical protein